MRKGSRAWGARFENFTITALKQISWSGCVVLSCSTDIAIFFHDPSSNVTLVSFILL